MDPVAVGAVILLVILLVVWVARSRQASISEQQVRDKLRRSTQYSFSDHINTIFVVLPCGPGDGGRCAETLFSLFDQADAPWRVSVGVMHHVDPSSGSGVVAATAENAVVIYEQLCRQAGAESYAGNIRLLIRPLAEAAGPTAARAVIHRQLYRRERFCASIVSGARMAPRWDATALRLLEGCRRISKRPILTAQPRQHDDRDPDGQRPQPTFTVVVAADAGGFPVYAPGVVFSQLPLRCHRTALYTPTLAFAAAEDMRLALPDPELRFVGGGPAAYTEGLRFHTAGCSFFTPAEALCTVPPVAVRWWQQLADKFRQLARAHALVRARAVAHRDRCTVCDGSRDEHTPAHHVGHPFSAAAPAADAVFSEAGLGSERTIESYVELSGIKLGEQPSSLARLGLVGPPDDDEVVSKFRDRETLTALLAAMKSN
jgi:hypothetical protein